MKALDSDQSIDFFHYYILPINAALRFHWSSSNSEVGPRTQACIRPSPLVSGVCATHFQSAEPHLMHVLSIDLEYMM